MNLKILYRIILLISISTLVLDSITQRSYGQDVLKEFEMRMAKLEKIAEKNGTKLLPDVTNSFDPSKGVELKWFNPYDYIKTIAIQKSDDKAKNYKTIGYLEKNPQGVATFVDQKLNIDTTYYRLLIVFSSDLNWYSNMSTVIIDSSQFIEFYKSMVSNPLTIIPQKDTIIETKSETFTANYTDPTEPNFQFRASNMVFYDFFDKQIHVDILSGFDLKSHYSLVLKDPYNEAVLSKINKIPQNNVVMDPRNFNADGLIKFELLQDKNIIEKGFIQIQ